MLKIMLKLLKFVGKKMADFQAALFLSLCFFLLAPILALIVRLAGKENKSTWIPWNMPSDTLDDVRRQY